MGNFLLHLHIFSVDEFLLIELDSDLCEAWFDWVSVWLTLILLLEVSNKYLIILIYSMSNNGAMLYESNLRVSGTVVFNEWYYPAVPEPLRKNKLSLKKVICK